MRTAQIARKTNETDIQLSLNLDGRGESSIESGVGFLDHMLTLLSRHGRMDLNLCLPMDEALILCAVDLSGRGGYYEDLDIPTEKIGTFDTQLVYEFMEAFAVNAKVTLHIRKLAGRNSHHIAEGAFKALGRVLREAVSIEEQFKNEIPSTKGML